MFHADSVIMPTPSSCIDDNTPPTFAGIATMVVQHGGSILMTWPLATDSEATEIEYEVYFKKGDPVTAGDLFQLVNRIHITTTLSFQAFKDEADLLLQAGAKYYAGVRARNDDKVRETNAVMLFAISSGVLEDDCATLGQKIQTLINTVGGDLEGFIEDENELVG